MAEDFDELQHTRRLLAAVVKTVGAKDKDGNPSVDVPDSALAELDDTERLISVDIPQEHVTRVWVLTGRLVRE